MLPKLKSERKKNDIHYEELNCSHYSQGQVNYSLILASLLLLS